MTNISKSCFRQNTRLTKLLISRTWWIQGLSSTCPVFKYFQGLEFRRKKVQELSRMCGNPEHSSYKLNSENCKALENKQIKHLT